MAWRSRSAVGGIDLCTGRDEHERAGAGHRQQSFAAAAGRAAVDGAVGLLAGHVCD